MDWIGRQSKRRSVALNQCTILGSKIPDAVVSHADKQNITCDILFHKKKVSKEQFKWGLIQVYFLCLKIYKIFLSPSENFTKPKLSKKDLT